MSPTAEQIESIKQAARRLIQAIEDAGLELDPYFMKVLEQLATNPVDPVWEQRKV